MSGGPRPEQGSLAPNPAGAELGIGAKSRRQTPKPSELRRVARATFCLAAIVAALWLLFYALWLRFPEITPGAVRLYDAKLQAVQKPELFVAGAKNKVLVVGHSYTMAGLKPVEFDRFSAGESSTFNLGLPLTIFGRRVYSLTETLGMLGAAGNTPTHVLVTWGEPWPSFAGPTNNSVWTWVTPKFNSGDVVQRMFPFRQIGRDGTIFLLRSLSRGGPAAFAKSCNAELQSAMDSRGYFFIRSDSIYPNDELPDNFSLRTDSQLRSMSRDVPAWRRYAETLRESKVASKVKLFLVPNYYREASCAPPATNDELRAALHECGVEVIGPDYWRYPNRMFCDAAHLNPKGADVYTRDLWNLVKDNLK